MTNNTSESPVDKRRRAFKKALLDEGITQKAFAERIGVHPVHVGRAFAAYPGLVSQRVQDQIDALIAKHSPRPSRRAGAAA
jgi:hypothetical protein